MKIDEIYHDARNLMNFYSLLPLWSLFVYTRISDDYQSARNVLDIQGSNSYLMIEFLRSRTRTTRDHAQYTRALQKSYYTVKQFPYISICHESGNRGERKKEMNMSHNAEWQERYVIHHAGKE